ncbi:iron complex transport system permease protein [Nocardia transvalensis]|uniref:Iron complex transport system permease protein n=1 Tax=Nocardia transvalensis TaxID=37333 RepID=A0A7W9PIR3_9NOCA|nr:iron ABC transporter permease [Nocardia transvalensis]MBB5916208.1 iron complex transport system permease protein [Nocardia transvalensis]
MTSQDVSAKPSNKFEGNESQVEGNESQVGVDGRELEPAARADLTTRAYRGVIRRRGLLVLALLILAVVLFVADVGVGGSGLSLPELLQGVFTPWHAPETVKQIVWNIRMPMSVVGVLVGASLAVAGVQMQTILNNPLAEPYTLGISAAAGFGAALNVVAGVTVIPMVGSLLSMAGTAWIFAMIACAVILGFSLVRGASTETMILLGIAMVFLFTALLSLMQYVASDAQLQQVVFWTMGSLGRADWPQVTLLAVVFCVITPLFRRSAWTLTTLRLGDDRARALGVSVERTRMWVLVGVSVLAATAVAIAGSIGFVGLVGPHAARMLVGENQRHLLPASALCGAILLSGASIASKLLVPGVIVPVGIITSIVGVPVFLVLILTKRRQLWA